MEPVHFRVLRRCVLVFVVAMFCLGRQALPAQPTGGPAFIAPADSVSRRSVPLQVAEPCGVARKHWPVRGGIPIPRGELLSGRNVLLRDASGEEIPLQTEVLGWWPDGEVEGRRFPQSVMWLLLNFLADVPAGGASSFTLEYGTDVAPNAVPRNPVKVTRNGDRVTLGNGLLSLSLAKDPKFIESIAVDGEPVITGGGPSMALDVSYRFGAMDYPPVVSLPDRTNGPKIDGDLTDEAWKSARKVRLCSYRLDGAPQYVTEASMLLDGDTLYVGFECSDPDPAGLQAPQRSRDDSAIREDDHVEIWLDPANDKAPGFVGISLSASGAIRDMVQGYGFPIRQWGVTQRGFLTGLELDLEGVKSATRRTDRGWTAEVSIPLDSARLNWSWTGKGAWDSHQHSLVDRARFANTFGLQLYRYRPAREGGTGGEESHWPFSLSYAGFRPGKFARIPKPGCGAEDYDRLASMAVPGTTQEARVETREVVVEVEGPVVSIVRVRGMYHHAEGFGSPFTVRFHVYGDRKDLQIFHTVTAGFPIFGARMKRVSLDLPATLVGESTLGVEGGRPFQASPDAEFVQYRDDSYAAFRGEHSSAVSGRLGWIRARTQAAGYTVASRDFWELYPAGYRIRPSGLSVDFYSPRALPLYFGTTGEARNDYGSFWSGPNREVPRVSRTHEVWLDFSEDSADAYGRAIRRPLLPFAGKQWNCQSLAMGYLAPYDRGRLALLEDWTDHQLWWWVNEQRVQKWYGWADFGNTLNSLTGRGVPSGHPNGYEAGYVLAGGYGWADDRKGIALAYLTQYVRSGRRAWLDFGEGALRSATDICCSYPVLSDEKPWPTRSIDGYYRKPLPFAPVCTPRRHAQIPFWDPRGVESRQGGQPGWPLFYFLTGDGRTKDVIEMRDLYLTTTAHDRRVATLGSYGNELRFLLHRWTMTGDDLYRDLLQGYFRRFYGKTLDESKVTVDSMYSWHVRPDKVLAWRNSTSGGRITEISLQELHEDPMHWELGGWEAPVRYCQLTGDPWLAKVLLKIGETAVLPKEGNRRIWNESILRDSYGNPMQMRADLFRWTARPQYLEALAGATSAKELAEKYASSPFQPAEPEMPISQRDLYDRSLQPSLRNTPPAGYLWPSGAYYRAYCLYPLQHVPTAETAD